MSGGELAPTTASPLLYTFPVRHTTCPTMPTRKPLPYRIVRRWMTVGRPDTLLSQHRSFETAQRAFDRVTGHAVLLGPDGKVLNHRIV